MTRWKLFLILILAVVLLHILIIKVFIIGSSDSSTVNTGKIQQTENASEKAPIFPEPKLPSQKRKK
ncbi:MAG: hypothetical protein IKB71_04530 [Lentisphaeria bacterium]|nr:hypothetical protein [Lentisphaeria bacterium]